MDDLLTRLDRAAASESRERIRALFEDLGAPPVAAYAVRGTADDGLRLWETRLKTSRLPSASLRGVRSLVSKLRTMEPDAEIEQFGFTGERFAGSIFFDCESGMFLGDTIVERRPKSQEMLDFEAQLFGPSRKSA